MDKKKITLVILVVFLVSLFSGCIGDETVLNEIPIVEITYPYSSSTVVSPGIVIISGTASDADGDDTLVSVEVKVDDGEWQIAKGVTQWSFDWSNFDLEDGSYTISVRANDGFEYSEIEEIVIRVDHPESVESDSHRWALFVASANGSPDNETKLGNGGLVLAEEITEYLVKNCGYSTSNIIILFDDGWIRNDNGCGERVQTLQQRKHTYDVTYGGATKQNVKAAIDYIITESNQFTDSEVFMWFFSHGVGEEEDTRTGGKIFESSEIVLWDDILVDNELGHMLDKLKSEETCIIVDACFSGGFADKTIFSYPTFFLLKSEIPRTGRVVISGASKYRVGYASTTQGPLFTLLWFEGLKTGAADGYRPGFFDTGRPTKLKRYKDGKVSVEEAFYYARYTLKNDDQLKDYCEMEPQINDMYPRRILDRDGLVLGD